MNLCINCFSSCNIVSLIEIDYRDAYFVPTAPMMHCFHTSSLLVFAVLESSAHPAAVIANSSNSPSPPNGVKPEPKADTLQNGQKYAGGLTVSHWFRVCRPLVWLQCVTLHQVLWLHWVLHFRPDGVRLVQPTLRPQPAARPLSVQQQFGPRGTEVVAGEDKEMALPLKISLGWGRWSHLITWINLN